MNEKQNNPKPGTSPFKKLRNPLAKFGPILTSVIILLYVCWFATGIFKIQFDLIWLLISAVCVLFAFSMIIILKNYKRYDKSIANLVWRNFKKGNKYIFVSWFAFAKMAYILLFIFIFHNLILFYKKPAATTEVISNLVFVTFVIPLLFSIALADGVNIWNIKTEAKNTLREKLFITRLH